MTATTDAQFSDADSPTRPVARLEQYDAQISQLPYLPGLDGIRAIAVVAVMVYHANSDWLPGGYLGVEVFFVISGYLITLLLIAEHERTGAIDLGQFWLRRFRRLLPALFVMMLLLAVWVSLFERDTLGKLRGDVIAGVLYGSNWYQIFIGAGYSAGSDFAPLRHLWSLAVEEQFYVVWPLVMLGFTRFGSRRIAGIARWLFLAAVAVTVIVAVLHHSGPQQSPELTPEAYWTFGERTISKPDALYLSTFSRAGGLLLGAAFAMVWRPQAVMRGPLREKGAMFDAAAMLGFVALAAMCWFVSFSPAEGVHAFLFRGGLFFTGIATLAVIAAVTHRGAFTGRVLSMPVLLWIGTRSYGLYLYHWPIYQIIRNIAANKLAFHEFVLAMVATAIITELSYRYVETPIRQGKLGDWFRARRAGQRSRGLTDGQRKAVLGGGALTLALSVFAVGSMATAELIQNDTARIGEQGKEFTCDLLIPGDCDDDEPVDPADEGPIVTEPAVPAGDEFETVDPTQEAAPLPDDAGAEELAPTEDGSVVPVPGSTEPPPAATTGGRIAVGDSVMLGAAEQLDELGFNVSAIESRAWVNGLDYVQRLINEGIVPDQLLIHLGTNGNIGQSGMDQMMAAVTEVPFVVLVTNELPANRELAASNNELIFNTAAAYPNVTVLDWGGLTDACEGDCFAADGIHLNPPGRRYYASLVAGVFGI